MEKRTLSPADFQRIRYEVATGDISQHFSFNYWLSKWPDLIKSLGSHETLTEGEFLRQHKATALTLDGQVIAIHLLSEFDESEFHTHPYFAPYKPKFFSYLKENKVKRVQTLQWIMVDESFAGHSFGAVILSLSLKHQVAGQADASVTIARADNSMTNTCLQVGMLQVDQDELHNVVVSHLACLQPKPYYKETVSKLADELWERRETIHFEKRKKVA